MGKSAHHYPSTGLYNDILDLLESRSRRKPFHLNTCLDYMERVRAIDGGYLSIPFVDGIELSMKIA